MISQYTKLIMIKLLVHINFLYIYCLGCSIKFLIERESILAFSFSISNSHFFCYTYIPLAAPPPRLWSLSPCPGFFENRLTHRVEISTNSCQLITVLIIHPIHFRQVPARSLPSQKKDKIKKLRLEGSFFPIGSPPIQPPITKSSTSNYSPTLLHTFKICE